MNDVLEPALVPYARFLEVRARRLRILTQLAHPASERPIAMTVASEPVASDEPARVAVRTLATGAPTQASTP
jgi:hypothetical protein